ncbi:IclR family transcriptional regulator [Bradyrhizobium erythrophlei]|uniref:IclR family transcriptional regulator n=1 Tax=Bradyrhizobium erythrophlei TaxID=1437360 RepID=UPI0035E5A996
MSTTAMSGTQTVSRAMRALRLVANRHGKGIRLSDIAETMALPRPTVHRLLKALVDEGLLARENGSRRYVVGTFALELGLVSARALTMHECCRPILQQLAERTGDTSFLFVRSANDSVCVDRVQGTFPIQTPSVPLGARHPLGITAGGLALLAALSDEDAADVVSDIEPRLRAYGDVSADELHRLRRMARQNGYALIGNRAVPGVTAVGLPVMDRAGAAIAAVAVASTSERMTAARVALLLSDLRKAADDVSGFVCAH